MAQRTALHDAIEAIKGKPYRFNHSDKCAYVFTGEISERGSIMAYNLTTDREACFGSVDLPNFTPPQAQPALTSQEENALRGQQRMLGIEKRMS